MSDNKASYECRAANSVTPIGQYVHATITLNVLCKQLCYIRFPVIYI